uniref:Uncharacterized protein n=1 Tax=Fagus sylvatica TaxID=28930 RepID=A0A2N9GMI4_FAGSY
MERKREKTKAEGFRKGNGVCGGRQESPSVAEFTKHMVGSSHCEISEVESDVLDSAFFDLDKKVKVQAKENPLISAVQMIGDGVSQVQSIGNQAVNNLVSFLNIQEDTNVKESLFAEDGSAVRKDLPSHMVPNAIH